MTKRILSPLGAGLVEMLVAVGVVSLLLSAMIGVLIQQQRFYLVANDAASAANVLERLESMVRAELMPLSSSGSDIVLAEDDSIAFRVFRGAYTVCARLDKHKWLVQRLSDGPIMFTDSALVYSEGTKGSMTDDYWFAAGIKTLKDEGKVCPDGSRVHTMDFGAEMDPYEKEVPVGAPLRVFEHGSFWLTVEEGNWVLKTDVLDGTPMVVGSPLGPASKTQPLRFLYYDRAGVATTDVSAIARIEVEVRAIGVVPTQRGGEPLAKERTISIRLRNAS